MKIRILVVIIGMIFAMGSSVLAEDCVKYIKKIGISADGKVGTYTFGFSVKDLDGQYPKNKPYSIYFSGTAIYDSSIMKFYIPVRNLGGDSAEVDIVCKEGTPFRYAFGVVYNDGYNTMSVNNECSPSYRLDGTDNLFETILPLPPPPPPDCFMRVNPGNISQGEEATLSWSSTGATSTTINQGIGSVAVNGSRVVSPNATTTYTGTFTGPGGTATCSTAISIVPPGSKHLPALYGLLLDGE